MKITAYECYVQRIENSYCKSEEEFFEQFDLVICGAREVREWVSDMLIRQVKVKFSDDDKNLILDSDTVIPMIIGGTEGLFPPYNQHGNYFASEYVLTWK